MVGARLVSVVFNFCVFLCCVLLYERDVSGKTLAERAMEGCARDIRDLVRDGGLLRKRVISIIILWASLKR